MTYQQNHRPFNQNQTAGRPTYRRRTLSFKMLFDAGPYVVAFLSFVIALLSLLALISMDVITGQITVEYMSADQFGWFTSFATTGLLLALIGTAMYGMREGWSMKVIVPIFIVAMIPSLIDVYFDAMSADIVRYQHFVLISELAKAEQLPHILFRTLVAGLSFVGEPLATTSVIIFPVLRELFKGVMGGGDE